MNETESDCRNVQSVTQESRENLCTNRLSRYVIMEWRCCGAFFYILRMFVALIFFSLLSSIDDFQFLIIIFFEKSRSRDCCCRDWPSTKYMSHDVPCLFVFSVGEKIVCVNNVASICVLIASAIFCDSFEYYLLVWFVCYFLSTLISWWKKEKTGKNMIRGVFWS